MTGPGGALGRDSVMVSEPVASVAVAHIKPLLDLPYAFAKTHGLVLRHQRDDRLVVAMR